MSTKTKFTKGDWRVVGDTFIYALNDNEVNQFTCLVQTSMGGANDEELMANAHLMAAAPKMYKFLDDLANGRGTDYPIEKLLEQARGE